MSEKGDHCIELYGQLLMYNSQRAFLVVTFHEQSWVQLLKCHIGS
jgi:hypothetical protein